MFSVRYELVKGSVYRMCPGSAETLHTSIALAT